MKKSMLLSVLVCFLCACTPLYRGFEGGTMLSPSRPQVAISVPDLPVLAEGQISPYVYTDRGFQFPETFLGVYGTKADAPLVITAMSFVPSERWEWDTADFSTPLAQKTDGALFGGQAFAGNIRFVHEAQEDPFAPLVATPEQVTRLHWLAQRFVLRTYFNQCKIILEYREPIPASLAGNETVPLYSPEVQAFIERARQAFQVSFDTKVQLSAQAPYLKSLNARYLGSFLGTMFMKELIPSFKD